MRSAAIADSKAVKCAPASKRSCRGADHSALAIAHVSSRDHSASVAGKGVYSRPSSSSKGANSRPSSSRKARHVKEGSVHDKNRR